MGALPQTILQNSNAIVQFQATLTQNKVYKIKNDECKPILCVDFVSRVYSKLNFDPIALEML